LSVFKIKGLFPTCQFGRSALNQETIDCVPKEPGTSPQTLGIWMFPIYHYSTLEGVTSLPVQDSADAIIPQTGDVV